VVVALLFLLTFGGASAADGKEQPLEPDWSGQYCPQTKPLEKLVENIMDWQSMWGLTGEKMPKIMIDFDSEVVAGIFLGDKPTGGYRIEFRQPFVQNETMFILYKVGKPTGVVTQAISQPYAIKVFQKLKAKKIVIAEIK